MPLPKFDLCWPLVSWHSSDVILLTENDMHHVILPSNDTIPPKKFNRRKIVLRMASSLTLQAHKSAIVKMTNIRRKWKSYVNDQNIPTQGHLNDDSIKPRNKSRVF